MDDSGATGFASAAEVAEVATAGVRANLASRDTILAGILQPVAAAAWQAVSDDRDLRRLWRAAEHALAQLDLVCGAMPERRFLSDVLAFCATRRDLGHRKPTHAADDPSRSTTRRPAASE